MLSSERVPALRSLNFKRVFLETGFSKLVSNFSRKLFTRLTRKLSRLSATTFPVQVARTDFVFPNGFRGNCKTLRWRQQDSIRFREPLIFRPSGPESLPPSPWNSTVAYFPFTLQFFHKNSQKYRPRDSFDTRTKNLYHPLPRNPRKLPKTSTIFSSRILLLPLKGGRQNGTLL